MWRHFESNSDQLRRESEKLRSRRVQGFGKKRPKEEGGNIKEKLTKRKSPENISVDPSMVVYRNQNKILEFVLLIRLNGMQNTCETIKYKPRIRLITHKVPSVVSS